ncbi:MAG: Hin recombinase [Candidatus Lambdaproteobacteria bacterium RIFOXYD2_FULL_50_16]|uniref:Hin recombinase n=1 Tax=Candidatus Lambdaproteobacteria bacterium RIFOXYD2_FULL_50_16 TaxID=1817772 RepID=A0A1F6G9N9_9PROT|nr:MAG: Hin recombinase [Candidatus Lambdaproteobacteria bacterium RIFOXYD2_FULL_50_16]
MKKSKFSDQQVSLALLEAEQGTSVQEVVRRIGITEQTFYRWKKKYQGMMPSELRKMKQIEEENSRLRKLVADLSLDREMLQEALRKKF